MDHFHNNKDDINNTAVYVMPKELNDICILTRRINFRHTKIGSNEAWELLGVKDLRGT